MNHPALQAPAGAGAVAESRGVVPRALVAAARAFLRGGDHGAALRVGLGLALPGLLLMAVGRADLMIYAVFGSVTGMYGRELHRARRLRDQLLAGLLMLLAGLTGILAAPWQLQGWWLVLPATACAVGASLAADRFRLRPAGPFFPMFAFGALATLPVGGHLALDGLVVYAGAVLASLVLGQLAGFGLQDRPPSPHEAPMRRDERLRRAGAYLVVLPLAGAAGIVLGFENLQWVLAGAVVPLAAGHAAGRVRRALHRVGGTLAGLAVLLVILALRPVEAVLALVVIVLMFPTEAYMMRNYGLALSFFTPLIMLMLALADPGITDRELWERAAGNLLGVLAGICGAWLAQLPAGRGGPGESGSTRCAR